MTRLWTFTCRQYAVLTHINVSHQTFLGFNGIKDQLWKLNDLYGPNDCKFISSHKIAPSGQIKSFSETLPAWSLWTTAVSKMSLNIQMSLLCHNRSVSLTKLDTSQFFLCLNLLTRSKMWTLQTARLETEQRSDCNPEKSCCICTRWCLQNRS